VNVKINTRYPSIDDLRTKAQKKIPKFAFEYLGGGCNEDVNLHNDTSELREVKLKPNYLRKHSRVFIKDRLFLGLNTMLPLASLLLDYRD
jgi:L-lactate dehydrogenase (cytochrome)